MPTKSNLLAKEIAKECRSVEEVHEHLKKLFSDTMQEIFEAEMDEHLGYDKHSPSGDHSGNSRNGYNHKTIKTKFGESTIQIWYYVKKKYKLN